MTTPPESIFVSPDFDDAAPELAGNRRALARATLAGALDRVHLAQLAKKVTDGVAWCLRPH